MLNVKIPDTRHRDPRVRSLASASAVQLCFQGRGRGVTIVGFLKNQSWTTVGELQFLIPVTPTHSSSTLRILQPSNFK